LTGCIYCIDNDIIKKLATFELFDETINLFNTNPGKINILKTAQYKFYGDWEKLRKGKVKNVEDQFINYEKTVQLAKDLPHISRTEVDVGLFTHLLSFEGINEGEATLASYVIEVIQKGEFTEILILTGDKDFLKALAKVELYDIQALLTHKLWCLEQLILKNIKVYGFEFVRNKIVPVRECDKAIKAIFGSGMVSTPENSLSTLNNYIEELRDQTGNLLHPYPN